MVYDEDEYLQEDYTAFQERMALYSQCPDKFVRRVMYQLTERSQLGFNKYGVTLERTDLTLHDWVQHAQEEAMDLALYLERIKELIKDLKL